MDVANSSADENWIPLKFSPRNEDFDDDDDVDHQTGGCMDISSSTDSSEEEELCELRNATRNKRGFKGKKRLSWAEMCESNDSASTSSQSPKPKEVQRGFETDISVLKRRQKQIDYGKNTACYKRYIDLVPKPKRKSHNVKTPNKYLKYSRRSWDNQIRIWRRELHRYDPVEIAKGSDDEKIAEVLEPILFEKPSSQELSSASSISCEEVNEF